MPINRMGNILNIIDNRNDFKKMDGLLPLQCGPFFNHEFDDNFEYKLHFKYYDHIIFDWSIRACFK